MRSEHQRLRDRSKDSERKLGKWLMEHDGVDPAWENIASSTSRVGHLSGLQFDVVSATYAAENKRWRVTARLLEAWLQINQIAAKHGKQPFLRIEPSNVLPNNKKAPELHIITSGRHAALLEKERLWDEQTRTLG